MTTTEIQKSGPNGTKTPGAGITARQGFDSQEITASGELAVEASRAREIATVQARFVVARSQPRDIETARVRLLNECRRPGFAAVARYHKPIGKGVEGPSIRFVEVALRCMGNIRTTTEVMHDDAMKRLVNVSVTDLENNTSYDQEVVVEKIVERQKLREGQTALRTRTNSYGKEIYLVEASEDDLLNKQGALISKAIRTLGLRLVPGDLVDEGQQLCIKTTSDETSRDPAGERRKLIDAFAAVGVQPDDLRAFLGRDLAALTPAELVELRKAYTAVKDGEATWREIVEARSQREETTAPLPPTTATTPAPSQGEQEKAAAKELLVASEKSKVEEAAIQATLKKVNVILDAISNAKSMADILRLAPQIADVPEPQRTELIQLADGAKKELAAKHSK